MKRIALAYAAGFFTVIALALYCGGDTVTQLGIRMSAASKTYDYDAVPRATVIEVAAHPKARR